jgi:hypothetical protein
MGNVGDKVIKCKYSILNLVKKCNLFDLILVENFGTLWISVYSISVMGKSANSPSVVILHLINFYILL